MREQIVRPGGELWLGHDVDLHAGFAIDLLEQLATVKERQRWSSPWLYAPTEVYSFGRCYREWTGWPRWLPIPVYGDHGVVLEPSLDPHEERNTARVHLTFNVQRATAHMSRLDRRVLLVQHPWITFRRSHGIELSPARRGTLFFVTHSVPGLESLELLPEAVRSLRERAGDMEPIVVMLHKHDIRRGLHREFIEAGLPVVTAGNTTSPLFIERFYAIVSCFAAALTDDVSSHVVYCEELGLPIRLTDPLVRPVPDESDDPKAVAFRAMGTRRKLSAAGASMRDGWVAAFGPDGAPVDRAAVTADLLGLDGGLSAADLRRTLRRELVSTLVPALQKHGPRLARELLRRARQRLSFG